MKNKLVGLIFSLVLLLQFSLPISVGAQTKTKTRKLDDKDNPDMIGKRDINNNQINFYSLDTEIKIGAQYAQDLEKTLQFVTDPTITEYINRLGQNIVLNSDAKVAFTIRVVDSTEINAFALPGGFFYVNKGLLMNVESESELVGVMAHEIAHVACRHAMEQQSKGRILSIATLPAVIFGGPVGPVLMGPIGNILLPLTFLKFSRGMESEADHYGAQYAYKAGYDPKSLNDIFTRLEKMQQKKSSGGFAGIFSDHPSNNGRIKKVSELIQKLPEKDEYIISSSDFVAMKSKLNALNIYNAKSNGGVDPNDPTQPKDGRPTLKRRTNDPISDDPLNHDIENDKPNETDKNKPPTLKRNSPPKDEEEKPAEEEKDPDDDKDDD